MARNRFNIAEQDARRVTALLLALVTEPASRDTGPRLDTTLASDERYAQHQTRLGEPKAVGNMKKRAKLLFLTNSLIRGGSERKVVQLANALSSEGFLVTVAYLNGPDTLVTALDPGIEVVTFNRTGKLSIRALRKLIDLVRARGFDVLVAINLYPCLYCFLAAGIVGRQSLKIVASINTTTFVSNSERKQMALYAPVLRRFDLVCFGAYQQLENWREAYGIGRDGQDVTVLYNGVDLERFCRTRVEPFRPPGWSPKRILVGTVAQFRKEKKHGDLISALASLRQAGLDVGAVLVGDGPERQNVQQGIEALGLSDAVLLVGETDDVRPFLAAMDVFVLPSVGVETFSNAALEAMAMSCPVVATTIGGMPEMLRDGGGLLYAPGNVNELVEQTRRLLIDSEFRLEVGRAARRSVEARFGFENTLAQFKQCISALF